MATTQNAFTTAPPLGAASSAALPAKGTAMPAPTPPTAPAAGTTPATKPPARKTPATPVKKPAAPDAKAHVHTAATTSPKPKAAKPARDKKAKLVRDSFTIPKDEYGALAELKQRAAGLDLPIKKSELLRAGIKALTGMSDRAFLAALKAVPTIKTGRPAKS